MNLKEKQNICQIVHHILNNENPLQAEYTLPDCDVDDLQYKMKMPLLEYATECLEEVDQELFRQTNLADKHLQLYKLMVSWVELKQKGMCLDTYFNNHGYTTIGIYGLHYIGERLCEELYSSKITIQYTLDKTFKEYLHIKSYTLADELPNSVDAIVVTPITFYEEIKDELNKKVDCPIISIKTILDEMLGCI